MNLKSLSAWSLVALMAVASACSKSSPTRPSESDTADVSTETLDASSGVTLTAPVLVSPADNARLRFAEQPITLTVRNAVSTGSSARTYTFQVATDAGFANIVFSREGVAEGSGQTSLALDRLAGSKDYFWRARATVGSANGRFTRSRSFNVGPEVVLQAPAQAFPANGASANGSAPLLTVQNADRSGPAGDIVYHFEVSDSSSFANIVFSANVPETPNQTSAAINVQLVANGTYFWRAQAMDPGNGITGPFSGVSSFRYVPFDMKNAIIKNSPFDLGFWREGAQITSVDFTGNAILVDFDRRNGGGRWPDVTPPGWSGGLQYTLGMCLNIDNQWYCSAVVEFWHGRELEASGVPRDIAREWFYDPARWAPMTGHQPQEGETIGLFVCEGDCRNNTAGTSSPLKERSNVVLVPFTYGAASYRY
jgi:hypothetical protein